MTPYEWAAQAFGIVAMIFNILTYQQKTQKAAIAFQLIGASLFAVNFFMLGATVGALMNLIAAGRAVIFLNKERLRADRLPWLIGFIAVYAAAYALTFTAFGKEWTLWNGVLELLPIIGMTATTLSFRRADARAVRRYGLISSPAWLIYNVVNGAIGAIVCEVLSLGSIIIGMIRLDRETEQA